jgi:hypothetical protein
LSWWKSLAALERWAESHPTHLAIFGAAMKYLGTMGPAARLKLYHEVMLVPVRNDLKSAGKTPLLEPPHPRGV